MTTTKTAAAASSNETLASGQRKPTGRKRASSKPTEDLEVERSQQETGVPDGLPLAKEEDDDHEIHPLPDSASGFRYFPRPVPPGYSYPCRDILELLLCPSLSPVTGL